MYTEIIELRELLAPFAVGSYVMPSPLRVVFMGTPQFSVPTLQTLLDDPAIEVVGVLTQPDKPVGRGQKLTPPPVKVVALEHNLPVHQPKRLRKDAEVLAWLEAQQADFFVTIAFGQILSQQVLDMPTFGTVNVHASLLPEGRGPNPIQQAILEGKAETGITTMLTDIGVDTGDMLLKETVPITEATTLTGLSEQMATLGAPLLVKTLKAYAAGELTPQPQDESLATHAPKLEKEDAILDLSSTARQLSLQVRAQQPWPGAVVAFEGQRLQWHDVALPSADEMADIQQGEPGRILKVSKDGVLVQTGEGVLKVTLLQPPGKKPMAASDWARNAVGKRQDARFTRWG